MTRSRLTRGGLLVGLACLAVGLQAAAGTVGLALTATVGLAVLAGRPPYDVAYAQVVVAATATPATAGVLLAELGVLALLAARLAARTPLRWAAAGVAVGLGVAGVGAATVHAEWPLAGTALVVLAAGAFVCYAVHRYERVALGLVEVNA